MIIAGTETLPLPMSLNAGSKSDVSVCGNKDLSPP
jgi:hypothetical protein